MNPAIQHLSEKNVKLEKSNSALKKEISTLKKLIADMVIRYRAKGYYSNEVFSKDHQNALIQKAMGATRDISPTTCPKCGAAMSVGIAPRSSNAIVYHWNCCMCGFSEDETDEA